MAAANAHRMSGERSARIWVLFSYMDIAFSSGAGGGCLQRSWFPFGEVNASLLWVAVVRRSGQAPPNMRGMLAPERSLPRIERLIDSGQFIDAPKGVRYD
jgi:hypothetical protein